jgi:hypothetical protein
MRDHTGSSAPQTTPLAGARTATPADLQNLVGDGRKRRILLRGGVVLSLDPKVGDFDNADVLIDGRTIAAVGPKLSATDAEVIDCAGTIVMPGFITTHHHRYETIQRSIIPDGVLAQPWPQESYQSVVQAIWTAGRVVDPADPSRIVWDLGRHPYDPDDCLARGSGIRDRGSGSRSPVPGPRPPVQNVARKPNCSTRGKYCWLGLNAGCPKFALLSFTT